MGCYSGPDVSESGLVLALDASNKKSYSQNEFRHSTDIFSWSGSVGHNSSTITRDTISSPVGNTPLKMAVTGNDPHIGTYNSATWNIAPAANGQTWIVSVYVKANVATTGQIFIFGANSSGTGLVGGAWLAISATTFNITTEWTRVSHYVTMGDASIAFIHTRLDGPDSGGSGQTIWWDGLQVERVPSGTTTPTPFTSSYYGGSVFRDLTGNSNTGTLTNYPTYDASNNGFLSFDGVDEYVSISNSSTLQVTDIFTINTWIYATNLSSRYGIFSTRFANAGGSWQLEVGVANGGTGRIAVTGVGTWIWESSSNVITTNTWYNICFVKPSNSTTGGSMYLNGTLLTPLVTTAYTISNNTNIKVIGSGSNGGQLFVGRIANCTLYNRALTEAEVQQSFNATRGRFGI